MVFNLEYLLDLTLLFMTFTLKKKKKDFRTVILENVSQPGFTWYLLVMKLGLCTFGKNTAEMVFCLSLLHI